MRNIVLILPSGLCPLGNGSATGSPQRDNIGHSFWARFKTDLAPRRGRAGRLRRGRPYVVS